MAPVLGYGAFTSVVLAVWDYTGGLRGRRPEVEGLDEFDRREQMRKNRRRPTEETVANLGEARGKSVFSPWWQTGRGRTLTLHRHQNPWLL